MILHASKPLPDTIIYQKYHKIPKKKIKVIWLHTLADIKEKFTSQEFPITGIDITTQNKNWKKNKILIKFA